MNNYRTMRLTDHRSANCFVRVYEDGDICFQSYDTDVLYFCHATDMLYCTGTYSQTTRKQIGWFLKEYFPNFSYHDVKRAYETDCKIDICEFPSPCFIPLTPSERDLMQRTHNGNRLYAQDFHG